MWFVAIAALIGLVVVAIRRLDAKREFGPKAGDLFAAGNDDGTFTVFKVLAVQADAIHVRLYSNPFTKRPETVSSDTLELAPLPGPEFGVGHMPISWQVFRSWKPSFLLSTTVAEDELDGYRIWQKSGGGVFDQ